MTWLFRRPKWPTLSIEQIRGRARILIVDDQPFVYAELFRRDGYNVEHWLDVHRLNDLTQAVYDIVVLDISDIGMAISADGGLGVLRHIKDRNPTQIVVAYSAKAWELKYKGLFDRADAAIDKSVDYVDMKAKLDELLVKKFSLGFYLDRVSDVARADGADSVKLRAAAERAIMRGDSRLLERYARQHVTDVEAANTILQVAQVAIGVMGLWNGR